MTKPSDQKVKFKTRGDTLEIVTYLEALMSGLRDGRIEIAQASDRLTLTVGSPIKFEVSAQKKLRRERICVELSWPAVKCAGATVSTHNAQESGDADVSR
jgi:amphi-Trp domain-containing protein